MPEQADDLRDLAEEIETVLDGVGRWIDAGPAFVQMLLAQLDLVERALAAESAPTRVAGV
jgi:hypothetical protein